MLDLSIEIQNWLSVVKNTLISLPSSLSDQDGFGIITFFNNLGHENYEYDASHNTDRTTTSSRRHYLDVKQLLQPLKDISIIQLNSAIMSLQSLAISLSKNTKPEVLIDFLFCFVFRFDF